jgi:hypothetical protein
MTVRRATQRAAQITVQRTTQMARKEAKPTDLTLKSKHN